MVSTLPEKSELKRSMDWSMGLKYRVRGLHEPCVARVAAKPNKEKKQKKEVV
ncbi:uncharacterized protein STEHIDRAFT_164165 [Stereum hirsutum FP-91666 SS1]|uniref:Uncharacterized protein n=1 Tax=Stereum hirsutum (strain FP-91666) TaxID=721885 RepID=R7RVF5_STEHR|nr:uncharacterized protein STEHIDRAFT_164165 [Stereum hirsutum FP-91666 SS1]EIM78954.1 hypothetical protein STEHIDRAFT_164165 [Stereum hirsutum FP-91666 SS1]